MCCSRAAGAQPELGLGAGPGNRPRCSVFQKPAPQAKIGRLWTNTNTALPPFPMGPLPCPGGHAVWPPLPDKQPSHRPGLRVTVCLQSLTTGWLLKRSSFSLQRLLKPKAEFPALQQWRTAPVLCGFTTESLSWTKLSMQRCSQLPRTELINTHIEFPR